MYDVLVTCFASATRLRLQARSQDFCKGGHSPMSPPLATPLCVYEDTVAYSQYQPVNDDVMIL